MATLKICTHDRTHWITNVREITLARSFLVEDFDDPLNDCDEPDAVVRGNNIQLTKVVDFQKPDPDRGVIGDTCGSVLWITLEGEHEATLRVVAPGRSCFLMSDQGATVDRI